MRYHYSLVPEDEPILRDMPIYDAALLANGELLAWDIATACIFLAGPTAEFITGETLEVSGGGHLWGETWTTAKPAWFRAASRALDPDLDPDLCSIATAARRFSILKSKSAALRNW